MLDRFGALLIGAILIFVLGLIDDLKTLPPYAKLLGQIVAACVLVVGLPIGRYLPWSVLMVPLMIFWIVGITNAFNLLDNMDGLSAGIAGDRRADAVRLQRASRATARRRCCASSSPAPAAASWSSTSTRPASSWATAAACCSATC